MLALNQYTQPILPAYVILMDQDVIRDAIRRATRVLASKDLDDAIKKSGAKEAAKDQAKIAAARHARKPVRRSRRR